MERPVNDSLVTTAGPGIVGFGARRKPAAASSSTAAQGQDRRYAAANATQSLLMANTGSNFLATNGNDGLGRVMARGAAAAAAPVPATAGGIASSAAAASARFDTSPSVVSSLEEGSIEPFILEADPDSQVHYAHIPEFHAAEFGATTSNAAFSAAGPLPWDFSNFEPVNMDMAGDYPNDAFFAGLQTSDGVNSLEQTLPHNEYFAQLSESARKAGVSPTKSVPSGLIPDRHQILINSVLGPGLAFTPTEPDFDLDEPLDASGVHPIQYIYPSDFSDLTGIDLSQAAVSAPFIPYGAFSVAPESPSPVVAESPGDLLSISEPPVSQSPEQRSTAQIQPKPGRSIDSSPASAKVALFSPLAKQSLRKAGGFTFINEFSMISTRTTIGPERTPKKGRRTGPLDQIQRTGARAVRNSKSVCIRCRKDKQTCDGFPCSRCQHVDTRSKQPCTRAHFLDILQSGTCNYISQRAHNHLTIDQKRRVRMPLPELIDIDDVLSTLEHARSRFDIRASQGSSTIFDLNLDQCYSYLQSVRKKFRGGCHDLRHFIDDEVVRVGNWRRCVESMDQTVDLLAQLHIWNTMPSRATYSYLPKKGSSQPDVPEERPMDILEDAEQKYLMLAAYLSRIVCRKLEMEAYAHLQKLLNDATGPPTHEMVSFVRKIGLILVTLRWRVSWWTQLGDGGRMPDRAKESFETRVNELCRILYFYYCRVRSKLPSWNGTPELQGVDSTYADTSDTVFDDFPGAESIDGYQQWMDNGEKLIEKAGVAKKLDRIGLSPRS